MRGVFLGRVANGVAGLTLVFGTALAVSGDEFRLENATLPTSILREGKLDNVTEASALALIGGRSLALVAHDKAAPLLVVDLSSGETVGDAVNSPRFPMTSAEGPKWEGMARDSEGQYYVVGSHSGKTEEERSQRRSLVRFRLAEGRFLAIDDASIVSWEIDSSLQSALKAAGVDEEELAKRKIEGLALRESRGRRELAIGLREPGDLVRVFVADVTDAPDASSLVLKPLFQFQADVREGVASQLTSLEYVPALGGFLVVTATEDDDNVFHGNGLWFVADGESSRARKIASFEVAMKAEGLVVLGAEDNGEGRITVHLLVTYDNDAHKTHIPSRFQTVDLVRESEDTSAAAR